MNYLSLDINDDIIAVADHFVYLKRDIKGVEMALKGDTLPNFENILMDLYLHAVKSQQELAKVEKKLESFIKE